MNLLNADLLKSNCANDENMISEMINMGLQSMGDSISGIHTSLDSEDWDTLARILHKLRPILCYCGITSLTDELLVIEQNAKQKNDLSGLKEQIQKMLLNLEQAETEMKHQLSLLSK